MSDQTWVANQLRVIADATADYRGSKFFVAMALGLTRALGVRFVMITEKRGQTADEGYALVLADGENLQQPYSYRTAGLPCRTVLEGGTVNIPCNIVELYPGARSVEAYCGYPLRDTAGRVIGLLAVHDTKPFVHPDAMPALVRSLAARAAAELECDILLRLKARREASEASEADATDPSAAGEASPAPSGGL